MKKQHHQIFFNTKILFVIATIAIAMFVFFFRSHIIFAINTLLEWYRVDAGVTATIDTTSIGGECKKVTAPMGQDHFIPTKSLAEWNSFKSAAPGLGIDLSGCMSWCITSKLIQSTDANSPIWAGMSEILTDLSWNTYISGNFAWTANIYGIPIVSYWLSDFFIAKLDPMGRAIWVKQAGWTGFEFPDIDIAMNSWWDIYVTGHFVGTINAFWTSITSAGLTDIFVAKLDSSGNAIWVKRTGWTNHDVSDRIKLDSSGNIYILWHFQWTENIFWSTITSNGGLNYDIFVAKLDSSGNAIWVKRTGWTNHDYWFWLDINWSWEIYVIWSMEWSIWDTSNIFGTTFILFWTRDVFIAKLDSSGNALWVKQSGWTNYDEPQDIRLDPSGNVYVIWSFEGAANIFWTSFISNGWSDIFFAKLDSNGNTIWVKQSGWANDDYWMRVLISSWGTSVYIEWSLRWTVNIFGTSLMSHWSSDTFVAKLDSSGNSLWGYAIGWTAFDSRTRIATNSSDDLYIAWSLSSTTDLFGTTLLSTWGDLFFVKLDSSGNTITAPYVTQISSSWNDYARAIALDGSGNVYVAWRFDGVASLFWKWIYGTGSDIFLAKLDKFGNALWIKTADWYDMNYGIEIAVDKTGNVYITAEFIGTSNIFWTTLNSAGSLDIFTAKLDSNGTLVWAKKGWWTWTDYGEWLALDENGNIYITWLFQSTADIFWTSLTSAGNWDSYVAKLDNSGNAIWAKKGWWTWPDYGEAIIVGTWGNIFVTWEFQSATADIFWTTLASSGDFDLYVAKLTSTWWLLWAKRAGWPNRDFWEWIVTDQFENVYITWFFESTADIFWTTLVSAGSGDILAVKLSSTWWLLWAKRAWGNENDFSEGISIDSMANIYLAGSFRQNGDIFWATLTSSGASDMYFAKLTSTWWLLWAKRAGWSVYSDVWTATAVDYIWQNVYILGNYFSNPNIFGTNLTNINYWVTSDAFLTRLNENGWSMCN
jgi:hypothetical protein